MGGDTRTFGGAAVTVNQHQQAMQDLAKRWALANA
jgi:hypothetical protein